MMFMKICPTMLPLATTCKNGSCEKKELCVLENVKDYQFKFTSGYGCITCGTRLDQVELRDKFPERTTVECFKCRTSYKQTVRDGVPMVKVTPDLDHLLVDQVKKMGMTLPLISPFRRREVKIIQPDADLDEDRFYEGKFPVLENGDYPLLGNIGTIIDMKGLSEETVSFLQEKLNIKVIPSMKKQVGRIHPLYDEVFNVVRASECFTRELTLSRAEISRWKILDIYLQALKASELRILNALEASASARMWSFLKPFFNEHGFTLNSRKLERRVDEPLRFSSAITSARTSGNLLLNYFFNKFTEFPRSLHDEKLLGWFGCLGFNHGRIRNTGLESYGMVVDLNEGHKLASILGLMKTIQRGNYHEDITKYDVWSWIGRRRRRIYYLGFRSFEKVNAKLSTIWENGYLDEFGLKKSTLKQEYEEQLQDIKLFSLLMYQKLVTNTIQGTSLVRLMHDQESPLTGAIKEKSQEIISRIFRPFTLQARDIPLPTEKEIDFYKKWLDFMKPKDEKIFTLIEILVDSLDILINTEDLKSLPNLNPCISETIMNALNKVNVQFKSRISGESFITGIIKKLESQFGRGMNDDMVKNNFYNDPKRLEDLIEAMVLTYQSKFVFSHQHLL